MNLELIQSLINEKDDRGCTPLYWSVASNCKEVIQILVACGSDINSENGAKKETSLHYAARKNYLKSIEALIESGANMNLLDGLGRTALDLAFSENNYDVSKVLLKAGAILHIYKGHMDILKVLSDYEE